MFHALLPHLPSVQVRAFPIERSTARGKQCPVQRRRLSIHWVQKQPIPSSPNCANLFKGPLPSVKIINRVVNDAPRNFTRYRNDLSLRHRDSNRIISIQVDYTVHSRLRAALKLCNGVHEDGRIARVRTNTWAGAVSSFSRRLRTWVTGDGIFKREEPPPTCYRPSHATRILCKCRGRCTDNAENLSSNGTMSYRRHSSTSYGSLHPREHGALNRNFHGAEGPVVRKYRGNGAKAANIPEKMATKLVHRATIKIAGAIAAALVGQQRGGDENRGKKTMEKTAARWGCAGCIARAGAIFSRYFRNNCRFPRVFHGIGPRPLGNGMATGKEIVSQTEPYFQPRHRTCVQVPSLHRHGDKYNRPVSGTIAAANNQISALSAGHPPHPRLSFDPLAR